MSDDKAMVIFQPSGRRGEVPKGTNIIEASRMLGVDIEALCGEKKVCGKCIVRIEEGHYEKYNITSTKENASAWLEEEEKFITAAGRDRRLSSALITTGNMSGPGSRLSALHACEARLGSGRVRVDHLEDEALQGVEPLLEETDAGTGGVGRSHHHLEVAFTSDGLKET